MIVKITRAYTCHYHDNNSTVAYVEWIDTNNKSGRTEGKENNPHMTELFRRAKREGAPITREVW